MESAGCLQCTLRLKTSTWRRTRDNVSHQRFYCRFTTETPAYRYRASASRSTRKKRETTATTTTTTTKNDPIPLSVEYNRCKYSVDSTVGLRERGRSSKSTAQVERLEKV